MRKKKLSKADKLSRQRLIHETKKDILQVVSNLYHFLPDNEDADLAPFFSLLMSKQGELIALTGGTCPTCRRSM